MFTTLPPTLNSCSPEQIAALPELTISLESWLRMQISGFTTESAVSDQLDLKRLKARYLEARRLKLVLSGAPSYANILQQDGDEYFLRRVVSYWPDSSELSLV